jgi:hypothetical protein
MAHVVVDFLHSDNSHAHQPQQQCRHTQATRRRKQNPPPHRRSIVLGVDLLLTDQVERQVVIASQARHRICAISRLIRARLFNSV